MIFESLIRLLLIDVGSTQVLIIFSNEIDSIHGKMANRQIGSAIWYKLILHIVRVNSLIRVCGRLLTVVSQWETCHSFSYIVLYMGLVVSSLLGRIARNWWGSFRKNTCWRQVVSTQSTYVSWECKHSVPKKCFCLELWILSLKET